MVLVGVEVACPLSSVPFEMTALQPRRPISPFSSFYHPQFEYSFKLIKISQRNPVDRWSTFARIGTGLSYADFVTVRAKSWIDWGENGPPFLLTSPKSTDDKGDVYLNPEEYAHPFSR